MQSWHYGVIRIINKNIKHTPSMTDMRGKIRITLFHPTVLRVPNPGVAILIIVCPSDFHRKIIPSIATTSSSDAIFIPKMSKLNQSPAS